MPQGGGWMNQAADFWGRANEIERQNAAIREQQAQQKKAEKAKQVEMEMETIKELMASPTTNPDHLPVLAERWAELGGIKAPAIQQTAQEFEARERAKPFQGMPQGQQNIPQATLQPQAKIDPMQWNQMAEASVQPENSGQAPIESTAFQEGMVPQVQQQPEQPMQDLQGPMPDGSAMPPIPMQEQPVVEEPMPIVEPNLYQETADKVQEQEESRMLGGVMPPERPTSRYITSKQKALMEVEDKAEVSSLQSQYDQQATRQQTMFDAELTKDKIKYLTTVAGPELQKAMAEQQGVNPEDVPMLNVYAAMADDAFKTLTDVMGLKQTVNVGADTILLNGNGEEIGRLDNSLSPFEVVQETNLIAQRVLANQKLLAEQSKGTENVTPMDPNSALYKNLLKEGLRYGFDSNTWNKDIAKDNRAAFMATYLSDPKSVLYKADDTDNISALNGARAILEEHTGNIIGSKDSLGYKSAGGNIEAYAEMKGLNISKAQTIVNGISPDRIALALDNFSWRGNALIDKGLVLMGIDPEGFAYEANRGAIAPAIAKSLGHVGNLNVSEVEAAMKIIPSIANTPLEAAALYMLIVGSINAKSAMINNITRVSNIKLPDLPGEAAANAQVPAGLTPEQAAAAIARAKALRSRGGQD